MVTFKNGDKIVVNKDTKKFVGKTGHIKRSTTIFMDGKEKEKYKKKYLVEGDEFSGATEVASTCEHCGQAIIKEIPNARWYYAKDIEKYVEPLPEPEPEKEEEKIIIDDS